jgi:putative solute:sodium symporter small subunit
MSEPEYRTMVPHEPSGHWEKTKLLMVAALGLWFVFALLLPLFSHALNGIVIFGFPLGFYLAAQGSVIAFVIIIFWFASRQEAIDREFGVSEED